VGSGSRLQVEVELIEDGMHNETRVLDLDVSAAGERRGGGWYGLLALVGVVPGVFWLARRLPRVAEGLR
jgi:hypothetical protein